jgi:hypothetical protein
MEGASVFRGLVLNREAFRLRKMKTIILVFLAFFSVSAARADLPDSTSIVKIISFRSDGTARQGTGWFFNKETVLTDSMLSRMGLGLRFFMRTDKARRRSL